MLVMTDIDNELINQKDVLVHEFGLLSLIERHMEFLRKARELFSNMKFVRPFWLAVDYGYKWENVLTDLQDRCNARLEIINDSNGGTNWRVKHDLKTLVDEMRIAANDNWRERNK